MRKFLLGFVAGAVTYHYVAMSLDQEDVKAQLREFLKDVEGKLADAEEKLGEDPKTDDEAPTPPSVVESPQSEEEGRTEL